MILKSLIQIAYPPICEGCGEAYFKGEIPSLCNICLEKKLFPLKSPFCERCGQAYDGNISGEFRCSNCFTLNLNFDFAMGAYHAEGDILHWIHRFKYANEIHFCRMFGKLMTRVWDDPRLDSEDDWLVIPVPLHKKRLRERGFNQSLEIAREWIRYSPPGKNLKLVQALQRKRYTTRQATLDRRERLTNLSGAFALSFRAEKHCRGARNFILVDDVLTTGTTASECSAILREKLAPNKVVIITVLRG